MSPPAKQQRIEGGRRCNYIHSLWDKGIENRRSETPEYFGTCACSNFLQWEKWETASCFFFSKLPCYFSQQGSHPLAAIRRHPLAAINSLFVGPLTYSDKFVMEVDSILQKISLILKHTYEHNIDSHLSRSLSIKGVENCGHLTHCRLLESLPPLLVKWSEEDSSLLFSRCLQSKFLSWSLILTS